MTDLTLRAWAYLSRVVEPPCAELAALVNGVGPIEAAERVRRGQVDDVPARQLGVDETEARREIDRAADDLELLARRDGRLITPDDDEWPMPMHSVTRSARQSARRTCAQPPTPGRPRASPIARVRQIPPRGTRVFGQEGAA
jgi:DNA processing protein